MMQTPSKTTQTLLSPRIPRDNEHERYHPELEEELKELKVFAEKIDELLASGYDPKLDDGVGKNIAPLQKAGLLSYEVLNAGQLKKYLNADW